MSQYPFYYDFDSAYAYLAAERIEDLIEGLEWTPIAYPILLGKLGKLEAALQQDPSPAAAEVTKRAAHRGLPAFNPPATWPLECWSLLPLRAALVAGERGLIREFSQVAFRKVFVEGCALVELEPVLAVAREAGLDPDDVVTGIERPEIKQQLKDNTEAALRAGVTGIPTVAIGAELFWGDDRLEAAAAAAASRRRG